jgi:hypothetical protein
LLRKALCSRLAVALHPVFLTAAGVMVVAFGLSWLRRDVPLRQTAGAAADEGVTAPRKPASLEGTTSRP